MAENEVVIHVRSEDETARGFNAARRSADKLGRDIEQELGKAGRRAGRALGDGIADALSLSSQRIVGVADRIGDNVERNMGRSGARAGRGLGDGIGDGLNAAAPGLIAQAHLIGQRIEEQLDEAGKHAGRRLTAQINDALKGVGSGGGLGGQIIPTLGNAGSKGGKAFATNMIGSISESLGSAAAAKPVMAWAVLMGLTVAPLLGSLLGAAVIGAGGSLGIVGGFAAAAQDPRVKGASIALKDIVSDDLKEASKSFVPAAIDAISQVKDAWKTVVPAIASIFDKSADLMDPLLDGILDGVRMLIEGIDDSLSNAGPVFEAFGGLFRDTLGELGEMFSDLQDDTGAMALSIDLLSDILGFTIEVTTTLIEVFSAVTATVPLMIQDFNDAADATRSWAREMLGLRDDTKDVSIEQATWHDATTDATDAVEDQISALRELEETMRAQTDPLFDVFNLQVKVRKAQETYNDALKDNGPHAAKTRKALLDMGKASFELTSALTKAASEGFNGKLTPAMRNALKNAGNTAAQINALEQELIQAWRASNKWATTYKAVYITQYKTMGLKGPSPAYQGYAHGGVTGAANGSTSSGMTMVGEHGPELVDLPAGTQVHSAPDTQRMMGAGGGGSLAGRGGGMSGPSKLEVVLRFDPSHAPEAIRGMMEGLRAEVRDGGGSVQTVLGVAGVS